jgi:hypothetical protein
LPNAGFRDNKGKLDAIVGSHIRMVGTLKPTGQMSLTPPSAQATTLLPPFESAFVQSLLKATFLESINLPLTGVRWY